MHVGWDWASQRHDVTVIDDTGRRVDRWTLAPPSRHHQAMTRLAGHGRPEHLPVAIEATSGIVVDRLLAAGHPVVRSTQQLQRRPTPLGSVQSQVRPGDSFKLAEDLRTDATGCAACNHRCRHPSPAGHLAPAHRPPGAKTTATNQLSALLEAHWPGARPSLPVWTATSRWRSWSAIPPRRPPSGWARPAWPPSWVATATAAGAPQPSCFTGCRPPRSPSTSSIPRSRVDCIRIQVRLLGSLLGSLTDLDRALAAARASIPRPRSSSRYPASARSTWPRSWPRSARSWTGPVTSPTPLPRLAPPRSPSSPARAPWSSPLGSQYRCPQCPGHLRRHSRHASRWAAHLYRQARQRGKRHPQAIRILMRAWLRVIWACWHTGRPYDITHHRAEQRLAQEPAA
jgi:hypothetical protein